MPAEVGEERDAEDGAADAESEDVMAVQAGKELSAYEKVNAMSISVFKI